MVSSFIFVQHQCGSEQGGRAGLPLALWGGAALGPFHLETLAVIAALPALGSAQKNLNRLFYQTMKRM